MSLEVDGEFVYNDPSADRLRTTLEEQTDDVNSFFILRVSDNTYMQGARHAEGFYLEYRDGGPQYHYAAKQHLTLNAALAIVAAYARGDEAWRKTTDWQRVEM